MRVAGSRDSGAGTGWRVFVSHTSELRDYPKGTSYVAAVEQAISAAGHVIVDMTGFAAADQAAARVCAEKVRGCRVYVGVLGTRYGSPVRDRPEMSYTELEFDTATEAGLKRLVFLLDTEAEDLGIPPSALIDREFGTRQDSFRSRVQDSGLVTGSFASPAELGQLVERSLRDLAPTHRGGQTSASQLVRLAPRPVLAGREELLAELDARLAADDGPASRTVVLSGLGGAGKTSVAVEYAYRNLDRVDVAWQFAAEDATVMAAGFSELAAQLGTPGLADSRDPVASVHAVLARFPAPWLLIFEDAVDMASLADFLPPAGPGRVLITSQNPNWPGQVLDVSPLGADVAAEFLVSRTRDPDRQAARDLADLLGGLPLALEQAVAYMQAIPYTLAGYLDLFRNRRADMLGRGEPAGYSKTVATIWALAFDRLQTKPGAVGLLRLLAYYAPEAIPLRLLLQPRPELSGRLGDEVVPVLAPLLQDSVAAGDAIGALRRYSLVVSAADWSVSVNRLVQAVTVDQIPNELRDAWKQAAVAVIETALPEDPQQPGTWAVFAALLPHAQAALAADSDGLTRIASYLRLSGSYLAAREFSRGLLEERVQMLGAEDPGTLASRSHLALSIGEAGDEAGARDQFAALLPVEERVLGPEHPDTLATRGNLAHFTGQAGDVAGARDQFAALLPVEERVLGPEHPDTLDTRHAFAYWTGKAGDAAGARDQFAALLPITERVLGAEHPDTLTTRIHLAWSTQEAGDAAGARDQFAALLPITERVLGLEHPRTLMTRHDLAWSTQEAGDAAEARDQFAALLPVFKQVLGPEHPRTLAACHDLAWTTGQAGDAAGARDQFAALLPVEERVLGAEHPDTQDARAKLAYWAGEADGDVSRGR
jgi:hypothetical protein